MSTGILLLGRDEVIESRAKRYKVAVKIGDGPALPFERTLITTPGTAVPWELLPAAWGLLERWDAAVPFWQYTETAVSVGDHEERKATLAIVRDLRVLLHATELLFVRNNEAGRGLVECWVEEIGRLETGDWRLAFLRAVYQVKPKLCVLPTSWLNGHRAVVTALPRRAMNADKPLVRMEIQPGRFVKCHNGDERTVQALMASANHRRPVGRRNKRRHEMATISKKSFSIENQKTRQNKGPLIRIELQPGRFVKMYEADAIAAGHIKPKPEPAQKARPAQENKSLPPQENKGAVKEAGTAVAEVVETAADDLTTINGIGRAAARLLAANGITTFEKLRTADVSFLGSQQQQAIEEWRTQD